MDVFKPTHCFIPMLDSFKYISKGKNVSTNLNRNLLLRYMNNPKFEIGPSYKDTYTFYGRNPQEIEVKVYTDGFYKWSTFDIKWLEDCYMDMYRDFVEHVRDSYTLEELRKEYSTFIHRYVESEQGYLIYVSDFNENMEFVGSIDNKTYKVSYKDAFKAADEVCRRLKTITKVIIKGGSGYGAYYDAYSDKVTIDENSITYEYKPMVVSDNKQVIKWKYKTSNPSFEKSFERIASSATNILASEDREPCCDIGATIITVIYSDKTKMEKCYFDTPDRFRKLFDKVKKLVPSTEEIPFVIRTYDEED